MNTIISDGSFFGGEIEPGTFHGPSCVLQEDGGHERDETDDSDLDSDGGQYPSEQPAI